MSIVVPSRLPSGTAAVVAAVATFGRYVLDRLRLRIKSDRDARILSKLPDSVLADMGLEKMEIMSGTNGGRETWVVPHRYR